MISRVGLVACGFAVLLGSRHAGASELVLAAGGRASVVVRVAADAIPAERNAAAELAAYLGRITGAEFRVVDEAQAPTARATIEIGPTGRARRTISDVDALPPERWGIRSDGATLYLYGGRPRGTLYAVYHFLEDELGVRFWTPWDERVPSRRRLSVGTLDRTGEPAFAYRDVTTVDGPIVYRARRRQNGHQSSLPVAWGGREAYGPPAHVHTAFAYVPPDEYFERRPELFSEIDGLRYGGDGQPCLSHDGVFDIVSARLSAYVLAARSEAERTGEPMPRLFDVSQNDWGRYCRCPRCAALIAREGSPSAPWVAFLNRLAGWAAVELPEIRIDTLAYHFTFEPPRTLRYADNVVLRVSALHQRDFLRAVDDPANAAVARALLGWRARSRHTRVWDYAMLFGDEGELPLPNLRVIAADLRWYRSIGIEGIYLQIEDPIGSDLWDLKTWVLSRLVEDPRLDLAALVREFTDGYYGRAAEPVRAYLRALDGAARRNPARMGYRPDPRDYAYLDARFVLEAQRLFDRAERVVARDPEHLRRVRHARSALDRATLARWPALVGEPDAGPRVRAAFDRAGIERRFRATWAEQAERRLGPAAVERVLAEVDRQIAYWSARGVDTSAPIVEP